jgi:hypothetical protein
MQSCSVSASDNQTKIVPTGRQRPWHSAASVKPRTSGNARRPASSQGAALRAVRSLFPCRIKHRWVEYGDGF